MRQIPRLSGAFEAIVVDLRVLGALRELVVGARRVSVPVVVMFGFLRGEHLLEAALRADQFAITLPIPLAVVGTAFGGGSGALLGGGWRLVAGCWLYWNVGGVPKTETANM